jgi:hypothetical protein
MKRTILATVLCLLIGNTLYAQSTIKGVAKDTIGNPIPYLQILLKQDGKAVNGAYTDDLGAYQIFGIAAGTYDIVVGGTINYQNTHTEKGIPISDSEVKFIDFTMTSTSTVSEFTENVQGQYTRNFRYKDSTHFEAKINPDYFLLGTFSDYMGRFAYIDRETQVDKYYPSEEFLAKYIADFIEKNYDIKVDTQFCELRHSKIFSRPIAEKLHRYFDEKGRLEKGIFDSEEKMYSFLTGVLLRYGGIFFDNIFFISVSNSPKRIEIYELLRSLGCNNIIYKDYKGLVPVTTEFYFEATPRIIKYYNLIKNDKMKFGNFDEEILEKYRQEWEEYNKELINSIKIIFKM